MRLGVIGCQHGLRVLVPAFRADPRCHVRALAGSDVERTAALAKNAGIPQAFGDWQPLLDDGLDAVAVAVPPALQADIIRHALAKGLAVFAEKPLAADGATAAGLMRLAQGKTTAVDFTFTEIPAFRTVKAMLDAGAIGRLRHVVINWNVENTATRLRIRNWKTSADAGGGVLGNFASHSLHYLEWFCGSIVGLSARLTGLPDEPEFETGVALHLAFQSGASGQYAMNCGAYLGSGHRLEFYGDDGVLTLINDTPDHMRGFVITHAHRPAWGHSVVAAATDPLDQFADGRIAPTARLARRFIDAFENKQTMVPGFAEGARVQELSDAVRRSHAAGRWLGIAYNPNSSVEMRGDVRAA